jgi:hypothetical protein
MGVAPAERSRLRPYRNLSGQTQRPPGVRRPLAEGIRRYSLRLVWLAVLNSFAWFCPT